MTTFANATQIRDIHEAVLGTVYKALKAYPQNNMGIPLDSAKDARWHNLRKEAENRRSKLRKVNAFIIKNYKKELRAERDARREARLAK